MSNIPMCACADFWEGHHPECPVLQRITKLEAQIEATKELHQAILSLEGSEGMTDSKFAGWVLAALSPK